MNGRSAWLAAFLAGALTLAVPLGAQTQAAPDSSPRPQDRPEDRPVRVDAPEETPEETPEAAPEDGTDDAGIEAPASAAPEATPAPTPVPDEPPAWEALEESPEELAACLAALDRRGTVYARIAPRREEDRDCGIANPLEISEILPGIAMEPDAVMRCQTALATATWIEDFVQPATAILEGRGALVSVRHGSSYVCRRRNNLPAGKLSEHSFGNAVDIMGFEFEEGAFLPIEPRARAGTVEEAFQRAVRGTACLSFTTVLGPGTDAYHDDHLHFDVKARRGAYRLCR
ncbi:extensin-like domain-containing protein [Profundibacterium mesophilum]|uniref:Extensin-like C-terminal domain-containing protein n=1 Tax=Profundibacterium mesophilum KAUST100406-0324 TaxID=1037889 RepID=A0A921NWF5_9RHOB|nr:extensin family protein [Profundibacterium mesophilum]KAF0674798.1 uncharacterized protein PMES_02874 [Profundibacterium mesophilum KAUST100406-0324]